MIFFVGAPLSGEQMIINLLKKNNVLYQNRPKPMLDDIAMKFYNKQITDERVMEKLIRTRMGTTIEFNNHLTLLAPMIKQVFPEARIILLIKHPIETIASYLLLRLYNRPEQMLFKDLPPNTPTTEQQITKYALMWNATYSFIVENAPMCELLRYEDASPAIIGEIISRPVFGEFSEPKNNNLNISNDAKSEIHSICQEIMTHFGYK